MDYNHFIPSAFENFGHRVIWQPVSLVLPYRDQWQIDFPTVDWCDRTLVIMHAQDFLTVRHGQCPELQSMTDHFGSRSQQVVVIHWNRDINQIYQGDLNLVYFPTHSYAFIQSLHTCRDEWMPRLTADRPLAQWQCLNGLIKPHRRRVVAALPPGGITSLGVERPLKGHQYSQYDYDNVQNWLDLLPVYATSAVNIVTESIYDFTPGIISEKTLQAWLGLQVPIIVGHQGIVQQCRDMGFDMFDDVIDNSHDSLPNDQRAEAAVKNNLAVLEQGVQGLDLRLRANQQRVLDWPSQLRGDFFRRAIDIHKTLTKP